MSMVEPRPRPGILEIRPYVGGKAEVAGGRPAIKLSSNESALGPSPLAVAAYQAEAARLHRYPDGGCTALRQKIAQRHNLDAERIVCGAGSDELIGLLTRAYAGPGDEVLYSAHGFLMYRLSALAVGAHPVAAPERQLKADVDALLAAVTSRTRLVFVANPNNPTGSYLAAGELERLHRGLPADVLLVIDAAYAEFVRAPDYGSGQELALAARERRDDPYLLEALRAGVPAARLDAGRPVGDRRRQPRARPVQRRPVGAGGRRRRSRRSGACREGARTTTAGCRG